MGLFGSSSVKVKVPAHIVKAAEELLRIGTKGRPDFKALKIADMSDLEKVQQALAMQFSMERSPEVQTALDTLGEFGQYKDVLDVPEFKGLYDTILREGNLMANRLGRSLQISGNASSTPGSKLMGRQVTDVQSQLQAGLSPYAQSLMNLRYQAPLTAAELSTSDVMNRMNTAGQVGYLPRAIQDLKNQARFNVQQQKALFPYQVQAPTLAAAGGVNMPTVVSGGGPTAFQQLSPIIGGAIGNMLSGIGQNTAMNQAGALSSNWLSQGLPGVAGMGGGGGGLGGLLSGIGSGAMAGISGIGSAIGSGLSGIGALLAGI